MFAFCFVRNFFQFRFSKIEIFQSKIFSVNVSSSSNQLGARQINLKCSQTVIFSTYFLIKILGGMFALGAAGSTDEGKFLKLGGDLAHTCHEAYIRSGMASCNW